MKNDAKLWEYTSVCVFVSNMSVPMSSFWTENVCQVIRLIDFEFSIPTHRLPLLLGLCYQNDIDLFIGW